MTKKLFIEGMSCKHCVAHVEEALKELDGVQSVRVNLEGKTASIELTHEVDEEKLKAAIDEAGYTLTKVE